MNSKCNAPANKLCFFSIAVVLVVCIFMAGLNQKSSYERGYKQLQQQETSVELLKAVHAVQSSFIVHQKSTIATHASMVEANIETLSNALEKSESILKKDKTQARTLKAIKNDAASLKELLAHQSQPSGQQTANILLSAMENKVIELSEQGLIEGKRHFFSGNIFPWSSVSTIMLFALAVFSLFMALRRVEQEREIKTIVSSNKEEWFRQALDKTGEAVCLADKAGNIIYINQLAARVHGLDAEQAKQAIGKKWPDLFTGEQKYLITTKALPHIAQHGYWQAELLLGKTEGDIRSVDVAITRLPDEALVVLIKDVSTTKTAEAKLHHVRQQYYQAQKLESLGRLAGGIAHDFNNVLSSISGYTEFLLQDLRRGAEEYGFAQKIYQGTTQAKQLVERLLSFSRTSTNGMTRLDLVSSVNETVALLKAGFNDKVAVETEFSQASFFVQGSPVQLSQILMNLGVNAYDSMEERGGKLSISITQSQGRLVEGVETCLQKQTAKPDHDAPCECIEALSDKRTRAILGRITPQIEYAVIKVSDQGTGIPKAVVEQMFEPFFTTKEIGKGTGLGLATVYGLVMDHKGVLVVDTTLKEGTSFSILLPLDTSVVSSAPAYVEAKPFIPEPAEDDMTDDDVSDTVLVVDDQAEVRGVICAMLQRAGYTVVDSASGTEALELLCENAENIKLIVTDFSMPGMSGIELAEEVALIKPNLPVILVSGFAEAETQQKIAQTRSIVDFIRKPVQYDVLVAKVRAVLEKVQAAA